MGTSLGTPHLNPTPLASPGQLAAEHAVYADFMRTVLEVINTIITTGQATQFVFGSMILPSQCVVRQSLMQPKPELFATHDSFNPVSG